MPIKKSYYKSNTNINKQTNINTNKLQNKNKSNKKRKIYRKSRKLIKMKGGNNSLNLNNISNNRTYKVRHPMELFITKKIEDKYIMVFDKDNVDEIDYDNIYMDAFFAAFMLPIKASFIFFWFRPNPAICLVFNIKKFCGVKPMSRFVLNSIITYSLC